MEHTKSARARDIKKQYAGVRRDSFRRNVIRTDRFPRAVMIPTINNAIPNAKCSKGVSTGVSLIEVSLVGEDVVNIGLNLLDSQEGVRFHDSGLRTMLSSSLCNHPMNFNIVANLNTVQ